MPFTPSDSLYASQWYLTRIGDIETIWDSVDGSGVSVAVYDDGVQYTHSDLNDNYDASQHVVINGSVADPNPVAGAHGTAVAGIIGAELNGEGTVGVAWGSTLTGVNIFSGAASTGSGFDQALSQLDQFDVTNHSWGYPQFFTPISSIDAEARLFEDALVTGRDGLGSIHVKAAGNDNSNANGEHIEASRATITVGAYDDTGDASSYSNYGANLLVSAPSNGGRQGQTTTDLQNGSGYSRGDYTDSFGGTSGASPVVAGVAALILDANEDLGWRDVQTIFAYSAHEVGSGVGGTRTRDEDHDWFVNGADNWNGGGLHFSEDYGFGSVNAYNAVRFAEVWSLFNSAQTSSNEDSFSVSRGSINLPDNRATDVTFTVTEDSFEVEYVEIALDITHSHLADLAIELISPDGTVTQLFTNDGNGSLGDRGWVWTLGANAFRGEDAAGTWTLRIDDTDARDSGRLNSASLTFFGRDGDNANLNNDVYHFTDEFSDFVGDDASRKTISDRSGVDWLNAAAVATASTIDFNAGTARIDGVNLSVSGIENAVTGDGNDTLKGDGDTNSLHGMRGNDRIDGEGGGDDLAGGQGNDTIGGGEGDDTINGNQGRDRIEAGSGRDVARGGDQRDVILGQNGNDNLSGGRGNDRVSGGSGDDTLTGNSGNDKISGGRNSDVLSGGHGDDTLLGRSGNDLLNGNTGHDSLIGGNGSDTLNGGTGNDALNGGAQADIFRFNNNWDVDTIEDFKDGTDLIDFSSNSDVNSLADLSIAANGGNAIITEVGSPGNVIIVAGAASLIDGADFIF